MQIRATAHVVSLKKCIPLIRLLIYWKIYIKFHLTSQKIVAIVIRNASNFSKAFKMFGINNTSIGMENEIKDISYNKDIRWIKKQKKKQKNQ